MIFLAVVNNQPKEMGLIQAIQHFIDHRVDVVRRRTVYLLGKARDREHILEGYKLALDNLDAVIKLIRASGSREDSSRISEMSSTTLSLTRSAMRSMSFALLT